jgi:superfamily II DNA/RNA helicase
VDVCLASNILEVGVDIDRLSLMVIVGQPKTTSQYIQVSGRVGRSWWVRPGLVVTIYAASKPRDRSHFEKFRSYHERLYSQVEPTSVTPFSPPALDRALHAIMAAFIQQLGDEIHTQSPYPFPEAMIDQLKDILLPRVKVIDPDEVDNFSKVFEKRSSEWKERQHTLWKADRNSDDLGLLRVAGAYATKEEERLSWPTQQSMRSVDAECITEILQPPTTAEGEAENAK